jgi:hypothetical protein
MKVLFVVSESLATTGNSFQKGKRKRRERASKTEQNNGVSTREEGAEEGGGELREKA